jgi:hypothetical protein
MNDNFIPYRDIPFDKDFRDFMKNYDIPELNITIDIHQDPTASLKLYLVFQNISSEEIMLLFDSTDHDVASSLTIWDLNGLIVEQKFMNRGSYVLSYDSKAFHRIAPGGEYQYELAVVAAENLVFFAHRPYPLQSGETYDVQYRYPFSKHDRRSNRIRWTVPSKREI